MTILIPNQEGLDHINVYSKSRTEVGRLFSNFYQHPMKIDNELFMSVEAYFHYIFIDKVNMNNEKELEKLRLSSGFIALKIGKELKHKYGTIQMKTSRLKELMSYAIECKIRDNKDILLKYSDYYDLPYFHYYVYGDKVVDVTDKYKWFVDVCSDVRYKILEENGIVL